jgi:pimeloyl-ACP methyl ester carboxylesterase
MDIPETRYARSGDVSIAYQVIGDGPFDLVHIPPLSSHVELEWTVPGIAHFNHHLASFARLIIFDKRGTGMSDPVVGAPTLETRMDDVRAVMDAVGSARAALLGVSEGGPMSVLFAATYPERAWALVLAGTYARVLWAPDYPMGIREEAYREGAGRAERETLTRPISAPRDSPSSWRRVPTRKGNGRWRLSFGRARAQRQSPR